MLHGARHTDLRQEAFDRARVGLHFRVGRLQRDLAEGVLRQKRGPRTPVSDFFENVEASA